MSQVKEDEYHVVGAKNIAAFLGLSWGKFVQMSKQLQEGGIVIRDHWGRGKRPYLWAFRQVLQTFRMTLEREKTGENRSIRGPHGASARAQVMNTQAANTRARSSIPPLAGTDRTPLPRGGDITV